MPIGIIAGTVAAAGIGAAATLSASSKNSKAINKSTDAQTASNADSIALQRDIYGQNKQTLSPFIERGNAAGSTINALLGLGGTAPNAATQFQPTPQPNAFAQFDNGYGGLPDYLQSRGRGEDFYNMGGMNLPWWQPQQEQAPQQGPQPTQPQAQQPGKTAQEAATEAYNIFKQSTGYQDRLNEGYRAINSGYAANGLLQSGAAQKSLLKYGQTQASNEFGNYMGQLNNQQGVGLSGASALAGVGQGYANSVGSINSANANAIGAGAVASANNSNATIGGLANIAGNTVGALSSYGARTNPYAAPAPLYGSSGALQPLGGGFGGW